MPTATFTIPDGTTIAPSERHDPIGVDTPSTILVVTEAGRNNLDDPSAAGQVVNLWEDNDIELILAGVTREIHVAQRYGVHDNARTAETGEDEATGA